ncbi:Up-regulator of cell proliferation [Labeo rohita]|uniref:Up-regulator of cell proliferation n=1 Tax=Labeo rohita TaxID=84645 RepID=A0ABQ8LR09_LABRO|nr:Up-regulator of cell proliferation [Labeo rohita]
MVLLDHNGGHHLTERHAVTFVTHGAKSVTVRSSCINPKYFDVVQQPIGTNNQHLAIFGAERVPRKWHVWSPYSMQEMALKMSVCQFSVPLLLPNLEGKINDIFKEPVALANLRGDISDFKVQFAFLSKISSAVFLFCDDLDSNQTFLESLQLGSKLVLVCTTNDQTSRNSLKQKLGQMKLKTHSAILKDGKMNDAEFVAKLKKAVAEILADSTKISIEKMSKIAEDLEIHVDENNTSLSKCKRKGNRITGDIKNIPEYKMKELPLQGKPWKEISKLEKEMCRLKRQENKTLSTTRVNLKVKSRI